MGSGDLRQLNRRNDPCVDARNRAGPVKLTTPAREFLEPVLETVVSAAERRTLES